MRKPFWKSKVFIGLILSATGLLLMLFSKYGLDDPKIKMIIEFIGYVANALGIPIAGWGRIATKGEKIVWKRD